MNVHFAFGITIIVSAPHFEKTEINGSHLFVYVGEGRNAAAWGEADERGDDGAEEDVALLPPPDAAARQPMEQRIGAAEEQRCDLDPGPPRCWADKRPIQVRRPGTTQSDL